MSCIIVSPNFAYLHALFQAAVFCQSSQQITFYTQALTHAEFCRFLQQQLDPEVTHNGNKAIQHVHM